MDHTSNYYSTIRHIKKYDCNAFILKLSDTAELVFLDFLTINDNYTWLVYYHIISKINTACSIHYMSS